MKLSRKKRLRQAQGRGQGSRRHGQGQNLAPVMRAGAFLLTGSLGLAQVPLYAAGLPVACPGGGTACGGVLFDNLKTGSLLNYGAKSLTIQQNAGAAIFNWQSFNISSGNTVTFLQPSVSSVALNRIFDPNVTTIAGNLKANGQIYLVNPNGILFGSGANVNVGGLIAATSDISDERIAKGLLVDPSVFDPVFTNNPAYVNSGLAASAGANSSIVVQPGATLYAAGVNKEGAVISAGRVFLFAPTVENGGSITVDGGGQVILAGGTDVYLGSSSDASLRGLLVEVTSTGASQVTVDATGSINVAHGNVTLMGLAVNQNGTVSATSALDANGSIRLIAREADPSNTTFTPIDATTLMAIAQTGAVVLGSGSKTTVTLDPNDTASAPLSDPTASSLRSTIDIEGNAVQIGGGGKAASTLVQAHGGTVTVTARQASSGLTLPSGTQTSYQVGDGGLLGTANPSSVIDVGADATIDVSGLQNVAVSGAQNFVYISRLTSTNLANAPFQRSGFLLGQGLYVNLDDVPSWLNVSNLIAAESATQAQRNTAGGTISLLAEGSVNLARGSVLNVSGGSSSVSSAVGQTSNLITSSGAIVNISNASPDLQYVGFADHGSIVALDPQEGINQTSSWQVPSYTQVGGFVQGANAGTVDIIAPTATLGGALLAATTASVQQRTSPPLGGLLQIGSNNPGSLDTETGFSRGDIVLGGADSALAQAAAAANQPAPIAIDTSQLVNAGFNRFNLTSDGVIEVTHGNPVNLGPLGQLVAQANQIEVNASITAPGGTVSFSQRALTPVAIPGGGTDTPTEFQVRNLLSLVDPSSASFGAVGFAPSTSISVAGLWTNDLLATSSTGYNAPIVTNGGSIAISGRNVDVSNATFDVSAGATQSILGAFSGGAGGKLTLSASYKDPDITESFFQSGGGAEQAVDSGVLILGNGFASRIAGFGVSKGGALSISAPSLELGSGNDPLVPAGGEAPTLIDPLVAARGFSSFKFSAYDSLDVSAGTNFSPVVRTLQNSVQLDETASAAGLLALVTPQAPLAGQLAPASITLSASGGLDGSVDVGAAAVVNAATTGSITIKAGANIQLDGSLSAQAGSVALSLSTPNNTIDTWPTGQFDSRAIQLGPAAVIDVSGASTVTLGSTGLRTGTVLNAGAVSMDAPLGSVAMDQGARIVEHGTSDTVDLPSTSATYQAQTLASTGGTLEVSATDAIYLEGTVNARAGGLSANGGSLAVELLAPNLFSNGASGVFALPETLTITDGLPALVPAQTSFNLPNLQAYVPPSLINSASSGFANVWLQSPNTIAFVPVNSSSSVKLSVANSLVLSSIVLQASAGSTVEISAPFVALGNVAQLSPSQSPPATQNTSNATVAPAASGGTATLGVNAGEQLDIAGALYADGIGTLGLASKGDVQLIGLLNAATTPGRAAGSLSFGGNLDMSAAQIYPSTQTDFIISTSADPGDPTNGRLQIEMAPGAAALATPLSAEGTLTFEVADFASSGRVVAPLGAISIHASRSVDLEPGSVLSVQGDGLVPLGTVSGGTTWTYGMPANNTTEPVSSFEIASTSSGEAPGGLAAKSISVNAPSVDAKPGSVIDVAGGGNIVGTQFVPGPGGSYDMSLNFPYETAGSGTAATTRNPYFALVPTLSAGSTPYDPQIFSDLVLNAALPSASTAAFQLGQTITIGPGSSLAAGTYMVLPPRYALLPGAYAVTAVASYQNNMLPGTSVDLPDGTAIVAGKLGFAAAGTAAAQWSGYRIYSDTQFRTLSQFVDFLGGQTLLAWDAAASVTPSRMGQDAGALQLDATASVLLASTIDAQPQPGGRGPDVGLNAASVEITASPAVEGLSAVGAPQAGMVLGAAALSGLDAESLVLGASEQRTGQALNLSNTAQTVTVQSGATLKAGEVVLAGSEVEVQPGASLGTLPDQSPKTNSVNITGDGGALYVGNVASIPSWSRSIPAGVTPTGSLNIDSGASVSGQAVLLDASASLALASDAQLVTSSLGFFASQVNLGDSVPTGLSGLTLTNSLLAKLSGVSDLSISSPGGINVYGNANIGTIGAGSAPSLANLDLVGPGVFGNGVAGTVATLTAGHITFDNSAAAAPASGTGLGVLAINSIAGKNSDGSVDVDGIVSVSGFQAGTSIFATGSAQSATQGTAGTGQLLFQGAAGSPSGLVLTDPGAPLSISTTRITALRGVDASITVPGALSIGSSGNAQAPVTTELGAQLQIQAQNVDISGRIDLPGGLVQVNATGPAASDGITLESGSSIRVAGVTQTFGTTTADASAGSIILNAASGSILEKSGAVLDVQGAGEQGDAGSLFLSAANGTVQLQGGLLATPGSSARGADIRVDAMTLANFSALAATIGGATESAGADAISLRAREGNMTVAAGDVLTASSIMLEADGGSGASDGSILIQGSLNASGASGGTIAVYANNQTVLGAGARLAASASAAGGQGGNVTISSRVTAAAGAPTSLDAIVLDAGAAIDVSGGTGGTGGSITLRANAYAPTTSAADVEVAALPANSLIGARQAIVEGVVVNSSASSVTMDTAFLDTQSTLLLGYMNTMGSAALARIDPNGAMAGGVKLSLRPGLEVQSAADITVADAIDFASGLTSAPTGAGNFSWRYGGATLASSVPGELSLRAAGNLYIDANVSDGFSPTTGTASSPSSTVWSSGQSWSYILTSGADLSSSNPNRVVSVSAAADPTRSSLLPTGNLLIGVAGAGDANPGAVLVRTGTGSINLNAGADIVLGNASGAVSSDAVYTAGVADLAGLVLPAVDQRVGLKLTPVPIQLTENGGSLEVNAGGDVLGGAVGGSTQNPNTWLFRGGADTSADPTLWWINFAAFQQGLGALGGGNLNLNAGRNIAVGAVVPSQGYASGGTISQWNSGSLSITAGGALQQGIYYDDAGSFQIRATSIAANPNVGGVVALAQGSNTLQIQAAESAYFAAPGDPLASSLSTSNAGLLLMPAKSGFGSTFYTYDDRSELDANTLAGTLQIDSSGSVVGGTLPPGLQLSAFGGAVQGDPTSNSELVLYPSSNGQLRVLSDGSISNLNLRMSQSDPSLGPTVAAPYSPAVSTINALWLTSSNFLYNGSASLHAADPNSAQIVSRNGSLEGGSFFIPKTTEIMVAGDIDTPQIDIQNSNGESLSTISAGGQLQLTSLFGQILVGGPGAAQIVSGGPMNLGIDGAGIISRGNLDDPYLPAMGASLIVAAGTGQGAAGFAALPNYQGVVDRFIQYDAFASSGSASPALNKQVLSALSADASLQGFVAALNLGLSNRASILNSSSAVNQALAQLSPAELATGAIKLAAAVQVVANAQFVGSGNSDTFAPAYAVFNDLFPNLVNDQGAIDQFAANNPFGKAPNGAALQAQALAGLPTALVAAIELGIAAPATIGDPNSAFSKALAAIDPATLSSGGRQLLANVLTVAGSDLDALVAAGSLVGSGTPFAKELTALAASYAPTGTAGLNDLNMAYNQINVQQTGNVAIFTPRGGVIVGQSSPPVLDTTAEAKTAADLGIFTYGGGAIIGMARDDFDVFESRVFTVDGGDIDLWSSQANIDAGRGARDVAVVPPPTVVTDANGIQHIDLGASVTGSGIGALETQPDQPPSNINLMAPNGYVDAGEAGIRASTGRVILGTNLVLNGNNIQAASGVSGGAVVAAPPPPPPPSTSTSSGDRAVEEAQRDAIAQQQAAAQAAADQRRFRLIGEFLGFDSAECGNETSQGDDKAATDSKCGSRKEPSDRP